ncbi:response regulator transcription factor [Paenibacillus plantiphilus]|uniref:response regulator transcription factor n=1 Tax=Paenibacillus plantiphilus TaxID=2905650 RepID=UPI001F2597B2|nr:response regulator transcription factor [Paenibacillus plantiphilus]
MENKAVELVANTGIARYKLLLIEDDRPMAEAMKGLLLQWGFQVVICENFDHIMEQYGAAEPHIVLMDINIPAYDGFYWCKKIREVSSVPIVFVSSRESSMDIVMAINNGGDDYIQKPFDPHVLVAKLQAIIRRTYEYRTTDQHVLACGDILLNLNDAAIHCGNESIELTRNEFKIMRILMERKGRVVSREQLMKQLWDDDCYVNENTLTVNLNRLRKRLEDIGAPDYIRTKKGMGYIIP